MGSYAALTFSFHRSQLQRCPRPHVATVAIRPNMRRPTKRSPIKGWMGFDTMTLGTEGVPSPSFPAPSPLARAMVTEMPERFTPSSSASGRSRLTKDINLSLDPEEGSAARLVEGVGGPESSSSIEEEEPGADTWGDGSDDVRMAWWQCM